MKVVQRPCVVKVVRVPHNPGPSYRLNEVFYWRACVIVSAVFVGTWGPYTHRHCSGFEARGGQ